MKNGYVGKVYITLKGPRREAFQTTPHSHTQHTTQCFPIILSAGGQKPITKTLRLSSVHTV